MHNWHNSESNKNINSICKKSSPGDTFTGMLWHWEWRRWWPKAQCAEGLRPWSACLVLLANVWRSNITTFPAYLEVLGTWTSFKMHVMQCFASTWAYYKINCCCGIIRGQLAVDNWGWAEQSLCDFIWFTFLMLVAFFQKALCICLVIISLIYL